MSEVDARAGGPRAAEAQQSKDKTVHIGILVTGSFAQRRHLEQALLEGLHDLGYVEVKNLAIVRRYADGRRERTPEFARELAAMKLDAVVTTCTPSTRAARQATASMPIIMPAVPGIEQPEVAEALTRKDAQGGRCRSLGLEVYRVIVRSARRRRAEHIGRRSGPRYSPAQASCWPMGPMVPICIGALRGTSRGF